MLTWRHNALNDAIARVLSNYYVTYAKEPRGFPMATREKLSNKKFNGPDGLLNTYQGTTVVEIHCAHSRIYYKSGENTNGIMDLVERARKRKITKYENFPTDYPGIRPVIFTVSTGGVIHPQTITEVKDNWLPEAYKNGHGLIRALRVEVMFAVAKACGQVLQGTGVRQYQQK